MTRNAKQQVLSADVLTGKSISFLRCIRQHTFGYAAERKVYGALNWLMNRSALFNFPQSASAAQGEPRKRRDRTWSVASNPNKRCSVSI
jgi:hypothetical protein